MARAVLEDTEGPPPLSHCPTILMFIKMDNSIEGVLTKIANGCRKVALRWLNTVCYVVSRYYSLGCYSRLVAGIKLKLSIFTMATWMDGLKQA